MYFIYQLNTNGPVIVPIPFAGVPAFYSVMKSNGAFYVGAGTVATLTDGIGNSWCKITPNLSDADTPGQVFFSVYDGGSVLLGSAECQLVNYDFAAASVGVLAAVQPFYAPAKAGDAMTLTPAERDDMSDALLGRTNGVDVGVTPRRALMALAAVLAGKLQTVGPLSIFQNWAGTKNRVTVTTAAGGQRTSVTFDFS